MGVLMMMREVPSRRNCGCREIGRWTAVGLGWRDEMRIMGNFPCISFCIFNLYWPARNIG
jgi:hypothetical protein